MGQRKNNMKPFWVRKLKEKRDICGRKSQGESLE